MHNIDKDSNITKSVIINKKGVGAGIKIGIGTYFNSGNIRADYAKVIIGNYCMISYDVLFITNHGSHFLQCDGGKKKCGNIIVNDNVWIGWGAKIRGGVTIGDFAVIGMGAIVTKDVKPFHVVVGNPAKDIGLRPDVGKIISLIKKRCGDTEGTPFEILTKFKKQGYIFAQVGVETNDTIFYIAPNGTKTLLWNDNKFIVN